MPSSGLFDGYARIRTRFGHEMGNMDEPPFRKALALLLSGSFGSVLQGAPKNRRRKNSSFLSTKSPPPFTPRQATRRQRGPS